MCANKVMNVFEIFLLLGIVHGYLNANSINSNFCSNDIIKDQFGTDTALKLDGSNAVVGQLFSQYKNPSCMCEISSSSETLDTLKIEIRYKSANVCHKSVTVKSSDGHVMHTFGCYSQSIEVFADDLEEGIQFILNRNGVPNLTKEDLLSELYAIYIVPTPSTVLSGKCYPAVDTTPPTSEGPAESTTVKPQSTTTVSVKNSKFDSSILIGVVVGLGLLFLVFISCIVFIIVRKRIRCSDFEKPTPSPEQSEQKKTVVGRTLTTLRDQIKSDRPLPRIPASIRKLTLWKATKSNASGDYASVKSNRFKAKYQLNKQDSHASDSSYMEPISLTTISDDVTRKTGTSSKTGTHLNQPKTQNKPDNSRQYQSSNAAGNTKDIDLGDASYIHPLYLPEDCDVIRSHGKKDNRNNTYVNKPHTHVYTNSAAIKATESVYENDSAAPSNSFHDGEYMTMDGYSQNDITSGKVESRNNYMNNILEHIHNIGERSDYVHMDPT